MGYFKNIAEAKAYAGKHGMSEAWRIPGVLTWSYETKCGNRVKFVWDHGTWYSLFEDKDSVFPVAMLGSLVNVQVGEELMTRDEVIEWLTRVNGLESSSEYEKETVDVRFNVTFYCGETHWNVDAPIHKAGTARGILHALDSVKDAVREDGYDFELKGLDFDGLSFHGTATRAVDPTLSAILGGVKLSDIKDCYQLANLLDGLSSGLPDAGWRVQKYFGSNGSDVIAVHNGDRWLSANRAGVGFGWLAANPEFQYAYESRPLEGTPALKYLKQFEPGE